MFKERQSNERTSVVARHICFLVEVSADLTETLRFVGIATERGKRHDISWLRRFPEIGTKNTVFGTHRRGKRGNHELQKQTESLVCYWCSQWVIFTFRFLLQSFGRSTRFVNHLICCPRSFIVLANICDNFCRSLKPLSQMPWKKNPDRFVTKLR